MDWQPRRQAVSYPLDSRMEDGAVGDADHRREWRRASARLVARADQELREFKNTYRSWSRLEQTQFREALKRLSEANDILNKLPGHIKGWLETRWECRDAETGEIPAGGRGKLPPRILLKAINAWEHGDDYAPGGAAFYDI
jgi:hypothetical protein